MRSICIVVADDHPVVLRGLVTLLNDDKSFKIGAICRNGVESIEAIQRYLPDLALLDINMPEPNGLEVLKAIHKARSTTRVILLAASPSDNEIIVAREEGAYGVIHKEAAADTLISCMHAVADGHKWFPAEMLNGALERTKERRKQIARVENLLTRREIEVMLQVANALTNKDVANQLNITEGTVKIHLNNVYQKIGISNRTALANFAISYRNSLKID
jgi:DNA-binding NarL/FixJ family response regulator